MNLKSRTKRAVAYFAAFVLSFTPISNIFAESDDFGIWTSLEAKKKLTKKLELGIEGELRTIEGVSQMDRRALGISMEYKLLSWLKASVGYVYIQSHNLDEKSIKVEDFVEDEYGEKLYDYNIDRAYWEKRDRFNFTLTGSWKVGRVKLSLRERLQYQYTHSEDITEDKYRYSLDLESLDYKIIETKKSESEHKEHKKSTTLRSRITAKWDIKNCKIEPFASVELFTRVDYWKGHDKLRYRIGASYKINKDNDVQLYYQFQDNHSSKSPAGHAIGIGYSIEL